MVPDLALAASARDWPDRLHRFLLDHGGGRIVDRVMSADQAMAGSYDALLIDDVCSFLTPRLVSLLKQSGVEVIGVFMPEDGSDAKRRLLECGISDVMESNAGPEEFLAKIGAALAHREPPTAEVRPVVTPALSIGVTGPCEGVGMTEVAVSLAHSLSDAVGTVLIDMDPWWPSVAQRLDLPPHPNIRTALDHALHRTERLGEAVHDCEGLSVVGGRADGGHGPDLSRPDASMFMNALGALSDVVVADLGPVRGCEPGLLRDFDTLILVGSSSPVGVGRLIKALGDLSSRHPSQSVLAVVNGVGGGTFRRSEVVTEIGASFPEVAVVTVPFEERLEAAAWDGNLYTKGRFGRAIGSIADVVIGSVR